MCAELVDKLPLFTLLNSSLILTDKDAPAEEFIPRAHHIMSLYRDLLERGEFAGKADCRHVNLRNVESRDA
jgi:hypothetical protein